jgi:hypothetical protein
MNADGYRLADYLISGFFLHGRYRMKRNFAISVFVLFPLLTALCFTELLPAEFRLALLLPWIPGFVSVVFLIPWTARALRVSRVVRRLAGRGGCGEALRELRENGRPHYERREVFWGRRYAFFFPYGVAFPYDDAAELNFQLEYNKPRGRSMPTRNILWGKMKDGKWFPLAHSSTLLPRAVSLKPLQEYAAELIKRNPAIRLE